MLRRRHVDSGNPPKERINNSWSIKILFLFVLYSCWFMTFDGIDRKSDCDPWT